MTDPVAFTNRLVPFEHQVCEFALGDGLADTASSNAATRGRHRSAGHSGLSLFVV